MNDSSFISLIVVSLLTLIIFFGARSCVIEREQIRATRCESGEKL